MCWQLRRPAIFTLVENGPLSQLGNSVSGRGPIQRTKRRALGFENLESRRVMASLPFGALPQDNAEFMLGRVAVTPVFLESNGTLDANTENWTTSEIDQVLNNIRDGLNWWVDTLAGITNKHSLEFVIDDRFARTPVSTKYEPISRPSDDNVLWVGDFLRNQNYTVGSVNDRVTAFNNDQRQRLSTDWSFSIFIADASNDSDGRFASTGSFGQAFAYPGGLYIVAPSGRPSATFTHETAHIFWAFDEYAGGDDWTAKRGYYNVQNLNSAENPTAGFVQKPSIMASGQSFQQAFLTNTSSPETLAQIGWRDSDGDGIFDLLDVPLEFRGMVQHEVSLNQVRVKGTAKAVALRNWNSDGYQSDITLNRIRKLEYRADGGAWTSLANFDAYAVDIDQTYNIPAGINALELRFTDTSNGVTSDPIAVDIGATKYVGTGIQGVVFQDADKDAGLDLQESGLGGWTIDLQNADGSAIQPYASLIGSQYPEGVISDGTIPGVTLTAPGDLDIGRVASIGDEFDANVVRTIGWSSFSQGGTFGTWSGSRYLRADFATAQRSVSIEFQGASTESYGRLEAYDRQGNLITRAMTGKLANGQKQTLVLNAGSATIATLRAYSQGKGSVRLDKLLAGATVSTTTDASGRFSFGGLADGSYRLHVVPPNTTFRPTEKFVPVTVSSGVASSTIAFEKFVSQWQNPNNPANVDDLRGVEPLDALIVINLINRSGVRDLTDSDPVSPYVDVNGDGKLTPIDALQVINVLNRNGVSSEPNTIAPTTKSGGATGGISRSSTPSGEPNELPDLTILPIFSGSGHGVYGKWEGRGVWVIDWLFSCTLESKSSEPFTDVSFQLAPDEVDRVLRNLFA